MKDPAADNRSSGFGRDGLWVSDISARDVFGTHTMFWGRSEAALGISGQIHLTPPAVLRSFGI